MSSNILVNALKFLMYIGEVNPSSPKERDATMIKELNPRIEVFDLYAGSF